MLRHPNRYNVLLRMRKREEDAKASALAASVAAILRAQEHQDALARMHADALNRSEEAGRGDSALLMERFSQFESHLTRLRAENNAEIERLKTTRNERQQDFEHAHRLRLVIDKLAERTRQQWAAQRSREERAELDDLVVMRYAHLRRYARTTEP